MCWILQVNSTPQIVTPGALKLWTSRMVWRSRIGRLTGKTADVLDPLVIPEMLYLSLVRSPYPHAEIKNIDISEAMKVPGSRR